MKPFRTKITFLMLFTLLRMRNLRDQILLEIDFITKEYKSNGKKQFPGTIHMRRQTGNSTFQQEHTTNGQQQIRHHAMEALQCIIVCTSRQDKNLQSLLCHKKIYFKNKRKPKKRLRIFKVVLFI